MKKNRIYLLLIMVLALTLTACGTDDGVTPQDKPPVVVDNDNTNNYASIKILPEDAYDIFMDMYPDAKIKEIQLDKSKDEYVYKVEGFEGKMEHELKINSVDGSIIKQSSETDMEIDNQEILRENVIKVKALVDEALSFEDTTLDEWTLEIDDGYTKLEVELNKKGFEDQERTYNVETGQVVEIDD